MNIAYGWLQEFIQTSLSPEALADKLRVATCEVESIREWGSSFKDLIIGSVLTVEKHPQADRLRIATVATGEVTPRTIVCGAPNLAVGQTVVVARPGTVLYPLKGEPFTIQTATLRGIVSEGMLCAAEEIGLPLVSFGILVLSGTHAPGSSFAEVAQLNDTVLDLEITPNRPDLLSYVGIAREIGALEKKPFHMPSIGSMEPTTGRSAALHISIEDSRLCSRYSALRIENLTVGESPLWMQSRLLLCGIRAVNTVVDVTNYVMLELGQPLHAFDAGALADGPSSVTVRGAIAGESLHTLDGQERKLSAGDIVVSTPQGDIISLAGIMGGEASSIKPATTTIIIESAHFNGGQIRRTSRALGLRSEASSRFEKELDPETTVTALKRAAYLLQELCPQSVVHSLSDTYPRGRGERARIHVSFARIQQILGAHISASEAKSILLHLGFQIPSINKSHFEAIPPTWRKDVSLPEDIIEELVRIWGFERLPLTMPSGAPKEPEESVLFRTKGVIRSSLVRSGYSETIHLSMTSEKALRASEVDPETCIRLPNPLSDESAYLIPSHLQHFLESCGTVNASETELRLFELGHVFSLPHSEHEEVSILLRSSGPAEHLYRSLKADCEAMIKSLHRNGGLQFQRSGGQVPSLQEDSVLNIMCGPHRIGTMGLIKPSVAATFKIKRGKTLLFCSLDVTAIVSLPVTQSAYRPAPTFPSSSRDITLVISNTVELGAILAVINAAVGTTLTTDYEVTDIYSGKPIQDGEKSVTIRLTYNAGTRTLTEEEVAAEQDRITSILHQTFSARLA